MKQGKAFIILLLGFMLAGNLLTACSKAMVEDKPDEMNIVAARINSEMGIKYFQQGKTERAKVKLQKALKQAPNSFETWDAMAYYLEMTAEIKEAEQHYVKAIELAPNNGAALNNYGTFLCRQKRYAKADKFFMKAVRDPDYVQTAQAYENAGKCMVQQKRYAKAEDYFKRAVAQDPYQKGSLLQLTQLYYDSKKYKQAKIYLDKYMAIGKPEAAGLELALKLSKRLGDKRAIKHYTGLLLTTISTATA